MHSRSGGREYIAPARRMAQGRGHRRGGEVRDRATATGMGPDNHRRADAERGGRRVSLAPDALNVLVLDASLAVELGLDRIGGRSGKALGGEQLVAPSLLWSEVPARNQVASEPEHDPRASNHKPQGFSG